MIWGDLDRAAPCVLCPALEKALAVIRRPGFASLAPGRYEEGDPSFSFEIKEYRPGPAGERPFEAHRRYADLHLVLEGREQAACLVGAPRQGPCREYWPHTDTELFPPPAGAGQFALEAGQFAVFFPGEAHRAGVGDGAQPVKKAIFKLRLREETDAR